MTTSRSKLNPQHDLYEGEPHTSLHALTSQVAQEIYFYIHVVNKFQTKSNRVLYLKIIRHIVREGVPCTRKLAYPTAVEEGV